MDATLIQDIIIQSGLKLGFKKLRDKQLDVVSSFIKGNDVLCPFLPDMPYCLVQSKV